MNNAPQISLITVTWNSESVLAGLLESAPPDVHPIVVDNCSADGSVAVARASGADVIRMPRNMGFGVGCNAGAAEATTEFLLFANPDVRIDASVAPALREALERRPDLGVVAPALYDAETGHTVAPKDKNFIDESRRQPRSGQTGETDGPECLIGAVFMMRRSLFAEIGGFDPEIFLYYEDDDLFHRVRQHGLGLAIVDARAHHVAGRSCGSALKVAWTRRFNAVRSKAYVARKYGFSASLWRELRLGLTRTLIGLASVSPRRVVEGAATASGAAMALLGFDRAGASAGRGSKLFPAARSP